MNPASAWTELASIVENVGARPRLREQPEGPATVYDAAHHICSLSIGMTVLGKRDNNRLRVGNTLLRMAHYVASRPALLPRLKVWARSEESLVSSGLLPRGYLTEETAFTTLRFLEAAGRIRFAGRDIVTPENDPFVDELAAALRAGDFFSTHFQVYDEIGALKITKKSLGDDS